MEVQLPPESSTPVIERPHELVRNVCSNRDVVERLGQLEARVRQMEQFRVQSLRLLTQMRTFIEANDLSETLEAPAGAGEVGETSASAYVAERMKTLTRFNAHPTKILDG